MPDDFDVAAIEYDSSFTFSNIGKAQRNIVYKYLSSITNSNTTLSILELNCGTGEDAIHFAKKGHDVIATDISKEMIAVSKSKPHPDNLTFKVLDINAISSSTFDKKFDVIFSNFGGLNCLSKVQLASFLEKSADLLHSNGKLILVMMPKNCLWERFYFTLKGDVKKSKRRYTTEAVLANVDGVSVKTWYYNPEEIISLTKKLFTPKRTKPVGIAIPPSYLEDSFLAKTPFLNFLNVLERIFNQSFWAKYADHFLIELLKK